MRKDITICIGTVGYPTFDKCYSIAKKILKNDDRIKDLIIIKDKYPTSAWLNEMRSYRNTQWVLQVDEDMYLDPVCISELLNLAKKNEANGIRVLNASGLLYDLFLKSNIGSLKLWNTDCFKHGEFKDVKGSDRQFAADVSRHGFRNIETKKVLGQHDSAPSPEIAYFKYKEYLTKIRLFQGEVAAKRFLRIFKGICDKHGNDISKFAYEGALVGLKSSPDKYTKNFLENLNSEEIKLVKKRLK